MSPIHRDFLSLNDQTFCQSKDKRKRVKKLVDEDLRIKLRKIEENNEKEAMEERDDWKGVDVNNIEVGGDGTTFLSLPYRKWVNQE